MVNVTHAKFSATMWLLSLLGGDDLDDKGSNLELIKNPLDESF